MSFSALCRSTLQVLRGHIPLLSDKTSQVTINGQPPAWSASALFLCIYPTAWTRGPETDLHEGHSDEYGITLAINVRVSEIPRDRLGHEVYLNTSRNVENFAHCLRSVMYQRRYDIVEMANSLIVPNRATDASGPITEPLMFSGMATMPRPTTAEWFHAVEEFPEQRIAKRKNKVAATAVDQVRLIHGVLLELDYAGGTRYSQNPLAIVGVEVNFQVTRSTRPPLAGSYTGATTPTIMVSIADQFGAVIDGPYPADLNNPTSVGGGWVVPANTISSKSPGTYDIIAEATYSGLDDPVTDLTTDELVVLDDTNDWIWSDGSPHLWTDDDQALWTSGA